MKLTTIFILIFEFFLNIYLVESISMNMFKKFLMSNQKVLIESELTKYKNEISK
jgi:hypothetical protein